MRHFSIVRGVSVVVSLCLVVLPTLNLFAAATSLQTGYVRILPTTGNSLPAGVAIFGFTNSSGILTTEAGFSASSAISGGRIFAEVSGTVNTGVSFTNTNADSATITFYSTNSAGQDFGFGSFSIPAGQQILGFLNAAPFNLTSNLLGSFTFTSSLPVSVVALRTKVNERNESLATALPVTPLGSRPGGSTVLLPYFPNTGVWVTETVLVNPGDSAISGVVHFYTQPSRTGAVEPERVEVNGSSTAAVKYVIPAHGSKQIETQSSAIQAPVGSVRVIPNSGSVSPSASVLLSSVENGITISTTSIAAGVAANASRMYVESAGTLGASGSVQSQLVISNPTASRVTLQIYANNLDGTPAAPPASLTLSAGGQWVEFASQLFPSLPDGFRGVFRVVSPAVVEVLCLRGRYNQRNDLLVTATPAWNENALNYGEEEFPYIAQGGGYSSQLVLISTGATESVNLTLLSSTGDTMSGVQLTPGP
jgi:hypothetical protein